MEILEVLREEGTTVQDKLRLYLVWYLSGYALSLCVCVYVVDMPFNGSPLCGILERRRMRRWRRSWRRWAPI